MVRVQTLVVVVLVSGCGAMSTPDGGAGGGVAGGVSGGGVAGGGVTGGGVTGGGTTGGGVSGGGVSGGGVSGGGVSGGGVSGGGVSGGGVTGGGVTGGGVTGGGVTGGGVTGGGVTGGGVTGGGVTGGGVTGGGTTGGGVSGGGSAGGAADAGAFVIARLALTARATELVLFVASEPGPDGGAGLAWARRGVDGGWTPFVRHPEVTSAPLSLDVAAWDSTRFDLTFQGACGGEVNRLCQQFWQNDLFSPVYDLGVPPDAGVGANGPFLPSALIAPAPERLAAYGFFVTPSGRRVARTAYTGGLPWTTFTSPATQPGFFGFFDGVGRTSAQGIETNVLIGRSDVGGLKLRALVHSGPSMGGGSWQPPTDLPVLSSQQRDAIPGLSKSLFSPVNWVVVYDLTFSGILARLQGDGVSSWGSWRTIEPAPSAWKATVSPSCTVTSSREVCAVVSNATPEVWLIETQELADGGTQSTFSSVGRP